MNTEKKYEVKITYKINVGTMEESLDSTSIYCGTDKTIAESEYFKVKNTDGVIAYFIEH